MYKQYRFVALLFVAACGSDEPTTTPIDVTATLALDQPMQLDLGDAGLHTFTLLQQRLDRAILKIESEPQTWPFTPGIAQAIDLNGEGGPEIVVDVTNNDDGTVTVHIVDVVAGEGMGTVEPPMQGDPWDLVQPSAEPEGTVLHRLTIVGQQTTPSALYDITPLKDMCDLENSTLYDAYVAETGGKLRIQHLAVSSRGFPYFEIGTQELRSRYADCAPGGMLKTTVTELTLDEKIGVDLDGNGSKDVDGLLRQVSFASGPPTLTVVVYAK